MTIPFEKSQKDEAFAHTMFKRVSTLPAGAALEPWPRARLTCSPQPLLKSDTSATIAETGSLTSEEERRPLSDGTGERRQQIVEASRTGV